MFSPYYFAARKEGDANPEAFCAINVAVYGPGVSSWVFTEWPESDVHRSAERFTLGTNRFSWDDTSLTIAIDDEVPSQKRRVRGTVRIEPDWVYDQNFSLHPEERHHWRAIAPTSRMVVALTEPEWSFTGSGYFDNNWGDEPLEMGMNRWTWSRYRVADDTVVFYDALARDSHAQQMALRFHKGGRISNIHPTPPERALPRTFLWALPRTTRSEQPRPKVRRTWEDTPFYSRTSTETVVDGTPVHGVNESLFLDRFRTRWMQFMLPYRILKR